MQCGITSPINDSSALWTRVPHARHLSHLDQLAAGAGEAAARRGRRADAAAAAASDSAPAPVFAVLVSHDEGDNQEEEQAGKLKCRREWVY